MIYKLVENSKNDINNIQDTIFNNRGIEDIEAFLNVGVHDCISYDLLDNIDKAVKCLERHLEQSNNIHIVVDSDVDGYTSAAMLYQYLTKIGTDAIVTYSIHTGKQHGLSDDITIPGDTHLIIIPDAGSSDYEQHKAYSDKGVDIIVLDHHIATHYSEHAIVVNNQLSSEYENKALSGAGVTYKFLQALDDALWLSDADTYLDLVAIANIGDVMDSRSLETRHYMMAGLAQINSEFILALRDKVQDRMGDLNIVGVAFYVVPLINAMIRVGTMEQKELMFKAMCDMYEEFDYTKRDKSVIKETIYERAARECTNAKSRQDTKKNKITAQACKDIEASGLNNDKIIMYNADDVDIGGLTGLVCNNLADKYQRPAVVYRTRTQTIDGKEVTLYEGSARNYSGFDLPSLRDFLLNTNLFDYCAGHHNAFGIGFEPSNLSSIVQSCNTAFAEISTEYAYEVDFIVPFEEIEDDVFYKLDKMKHLYGQRVEAPLFAITDIDILMKNVDVRRAKTTDNVTINLKADGVEFVKFRVKEDDPVLRTIEDWEFDAQEATLHVVGRPGISSFNGVKTIQVIVSDWEIISTIE